MLMNRPVFDSGVLVRNGGSSASSCHMSSSRVSSPNLCFSPRSCKIKGKNRWKTALSRHVPAAQVSCQNSHNCLYRWSCVLC